MASENVRDLSNIDPSVNSIPKPEGCKDDIEKLEKKVEVKRKSVWFSFKRKIAIPFKFLKLKH